MAEASPAGSATLAAVSQLPSDRQLGTVVTVGGQQITVGKLSINQWIGLPKLVASYAAKMDTAAMAQLRDIVDSSDQGSDLRGNLMLLVELLGEGEVITDAYALLVDRPEPWVREHFDMVEFLDVLDAVAEHNDVTRLLASFRRLAARIPSRPPSPPLSPPDLSSGTSDSTSQPSGSTASNG